MNFQKNKYTVIKNVIPKILGNFCATYLEMKAYNLNVLKSEKYITDFNEDYGSYGDSQIPNSFSIYGDQAMETLFLLIKPKMEKITKLKLSETYAYARLYKKGDVLKRHKDRMSCEISTTLNLGGDLWPIYLEPSGKKRKAGIKVDLKPGDMLVYKGMDLEHWRKPFKGKICAQVFLHFNDTKNPKAKKNKYDTRPMLGLPTYFKGKGKK
tara:strand:+ start:150 stop:779 length:630 start_codon:yes stop_codon:yes gene_type:complete